MNKVLNAMRHTLVVATTICVAYLAGDRIYRHFIANEAMNTALDETESNLK